MQNKGRYLSKFLKLLEMDKCVDLFELSTYVVGLGEADELLNGERVVWVTIGMLF